MFHSDEYDSFEDLYDRLVAYASTKHSLKMTDKPRLMPQHRWMRGHSRASATIVVGQATKHLIAALREQLARARASLQQLRCSVLLAVVTGTTVGSATAAKAKAKEQEQDRATRREVPKEVRTREKERAKEERREKAKERKKASAQWSGRSRKDGTKKDGMDGAPHRGVSSRRPNRLPKLINKQAALEA